MSSSVFRFLILALVFQVPVACSWEAPTVVSPGKPSAGPAPAPISPAGTAFPPLSKPGAAYDRVGGPSLPVSSRYVIYNDGTFSLQFAGVDSGFGELLGRYSSAASPYASGESLIEFSFTDPSPGLWVATGIARGDSIVVRYNIIMALSDFESGVYRKVRVP